MIIPATVLVYNFNLDSQKYGSLTQIIVKKGIISGAIIVALFVYFFMTLVILPQEYLSHKIIEPQPTHTVTLSNDEISLGESFKIEIEIENKNDVADILITSVAFPGLQEIGDEVEIIGYDYTQSPRYIKLGDKINSEYTRGEQITTTHPAIEAYSRNVAPNSSYHMTLRITPHIAGTFEMYVKTIAIPHTTELSHYPHEGFLDPQREYVSVYNVTVNP